MAGESKTAFEDRLRGEGRWQQFIQRREQLKAETADQSDPKTVAKNAWAIAMAEFPPPGMEPKTPTSPTTGSAPAVETPKPVPAAKPEKPSPATLVKLKDFVGKEADARTVVQWVFDHIAFEDITPEMAPSAGAWGLFEACRNNYQIRFEFYKNIWPRLLPNKAQLEALERFEDDGGDVIDLIDRCSAAAAKSAVPQQGSEGPAVEPEVPQVAAL